MALNTIDTLTVKKDLPIFTVELPFKDIKDIIVEYRNKFPENYNEKLPNAPVRSSWRSNMWAMDYDPLKYFVSVVEKVCNTVGCQYFHMREDTVFNCTNLWMMQYEGGDYAKEHDHFPNDLSCVYYAEVDDDSSSIIFEDDLEIKPRNNLLIVFPSLLKHMVPSTHGQRTVISMNFRAN
tara:strand:+ start:1216 stop:1752 length:537 start_codon:yes stop_codon:yes gene_type:complete